VIEGDEIPNLIDELPILAVAGALAAGETVIRDAAELRVKESDRIAEMVKHLRSFGVSVDEFEDGLRVKGGAVLKTPEVPLSSDGDHRISMSMAILNTFADGALILDEVECVDTSYPSFWSDMVSLGGRVDR
jgi:3-phosphoshikimate 1-carboxyvinyltransferase